MILAGDIGGTKTLLALYDWKDQRVEPIRQESYWSEDYGSLEEVLTEFLEEKSEGITDGDIHEELTKSEDLKTDPELSSSPTLTGACFGVAGPVLNNICRTMNLPWVIDGKKIAQHLDLKKVRLLNDLEATACGLLELQPDEARILKSFRACSDKRYPCVDCSGNRSG